MTNPETSSDLVRRLEEEGQRLSGYSIDRGSVDAGIASNLASEAATTIERLTAGNAGLVETIEIIQKSYAEREALWNDMQERFERLTAERDANYDLWPDDPAPIADKAADHVFGDFAKALGLDIWSPQDGSETWEGDVWATAVRMLEDANVLDRETGERSPAIYWHERALAAEAQLALQAGALKAIQSAPLYLVRDFVSKQAGEFRVRDIPRGDWPDKAIFNAVTYLTRCGELERLGYGRYVARSALPEARHE